MRSKTKQELEDEIKKLWKEIEFKDKKIKELDESRVNTLESCRNKYEEQKKLIEELKKGSDDIHQMCNSILKCVAHDNGGIIRVPQNHLEITADWGFVCVPVGTDYVFEVKGDKQ